MRRYLPQYCTMRALARLLQDFSLDESKTIYEQSTFPLTAMPGNLQSLYLVWTRPQAQDEVLNRALAHISGTVNITDGGDHPEDRKLIVEIFRHLRHLLVPLPLDQIHTELANKWNWGIGDAKSVEMLAKDIYGGKNPRSYAKSWPQTGSFVHGWITEVATAHQAGTPTKA